MKQCSKCKEKKPLNNFFPDKRTKDGKYSACRECHKKALKKWRAKNREKIKECNRVSQRKWRKNNKDAHNSYQKSYYRNSAKYREYKRAYKRNTQRSNPRLRIDNAMGIAIWYALRGKKAGRRWETLVGYSIDDLMKHIEKRFEPWMNWDNYGEWELDHIIPRSHFGYRDTTDPEFARCWALENLQPLGRRENRVKGGKLLKPQSNTDE